MGKKADETEKPPVEPPGAWAEWRDLWRLLRARARELARGCSTPAELAALVKAAETMWQLDPDTPPPEVKA